MTRFKTCRRTVLRYLTPINLASMSKRCAPTLTGFQSPTASPSPFDCIAALEEGVVFVVGGHEEALVVELAAGAVG